MRAAQGKSSAVAIRQSEVAKLFRGGKKHRLGDTEIDLARGVSAPGKAPYKEAARSTRGDRVVTPRIISRQLATGGASCVGVPKGSGGPESPGGSKADLACADSRAAVSAYVERASSGAKCYIRMFRRLVLLCSRIDCAPTSRGGSGAVETNAQVYAGYATQSGKGHWEATRFRPDIPNSEPRVPTQGEIRPYPIRRLYVRNSYGPLPVAAS